MFLLRGKTETIFIAIYCKKESSSSESDEDIQDNDVENEDNLPLEQLSSTVLHTGKDGTEWTGPSATAVGRLAKQNVLTEASGPTGFAKRNVDERAASAFKLLIDDSMLDHIRMCTEAEAARKGCEDFKITHHELECFISILYARGVLGSRNSPLSSLWSTKWGFPAIRKAMSRDRFKEIMRYLRFDEKSTRSERLKTDKFALVSATWNKFIENCILCYKPSESITIDEQLFPTKSRCPFTQYMANKPDKFGIKFWMAADNNSKYMLNAIPYLGKDDFRPQNQSLGEYVVLKLADPFLRKGRNITTDNFFTSLKLAQMLEKEKSSLVGTMRSNRRELPKICTDTSPNVYSSTILKHKSATLTIYRAKMKKNVSLLSTLHADVTFSTHYKKKPCTVEYYNKNKCGVDVVDAMARLYSVRASSRRWPVQVFYNILDLAAINAWVLYKECNVSKISRREFILKLSEELAAKDYTPEEPMLLSSPSSSISPNKRRQCQIGYCKPRRNKSSDICDICRKVVCRTCARKIEKKTIAVCKKC